MGSGVAGLAPGFARGGLAVFVGDSKGRGLSGGCLFQLLQPPAQSVVAIVEILDLLFEFLNFLLLLFNHASLAQNNFDEPIGLLAQRLQILFELR